MPIHGRGAVILLVCFLCIGCDQGTKYLATENLAGGTTTSSYLFDTVRLSYAENTGAFLGLGSSLSEEARFFLFTVLVGLFLCGFLVYLVVHRENTRLGVIALSLVFAGGLSNFYDRAFNNGAVVDFLNVGIGPIRTGIFNVADMAILLGAVLVIYDSCISAKTSEA